MIHELGSQAYSALRHNKRRSILTMLGMAWGIATVVLLLAYGAGFERGLWVAFRSFGTNLVFVFPGRTSQQAGGTKAGSEVRLTDQGSGLHPRRSASAQAALARSVQTMQCGLGHAQRQLRGERGVRELCPHATYGICRRHSFRRSRGLYPRARCFYRRRRQEEAFFRPERDWREHPRGRDLLPDRGHSETRHQQQ